MGDLFTMAHIEEQLAEIKQILKKFDLDKKVKVTHVNARYCDSRRKHFFGIYEGQSQGFNWFDDAVAYCSWHIEGFGSIRKECSGYYNRRYPKESFGNMVYVGGEN